MNQVRFHDVKIDDENGIRAELAVCGFTDFSALKNITQLKNKLKEIMIEKDGIEQDKKDIKFFPILSDYDWSKFLV